MEKTPGDINLCKRCKKEISGNMDYCVDCNRILLMSLLKKDAPQDSKLRSCLMIMVSVAFFFVGISLLVIFILMGMGIDEKYLLSYVFSEPASVVYSPSPPDKNLTPGNKKEEAVKQFVSHWTDAWKRPDDKLLSYYIDGTESYKNIRYLLLNLAPVEIEPAYEEIEVLSESFVLVKLHMKTSSGDEKKEGEAILKLQKPADSSWKIYEASYEPQDLMLYSKDVGAGNTPVSGNTPVLKNTPLPEKSAIPEPTSSVSDNLIPEIREKFLPCKEWEEEYREYFERHYKDPSLLLEPKAIVLHYTATKNLEDTLNIFIQGKEYNDGDVGLLFSHLSVHYVIDRDGTVYQTLPLDRRCRGAYGVNHVALSIEMVAWDEEDLLSQKKTVEASFELVRYLMEKFDIPPEMVWGHYQVSEGKYSDSYVKDYYTDYGDSKCPDFYPEGDIRSDPGKNYMKKLFEYLSES